MTRAQQEAAGAVNPAGAASAQAGEPLLRVVRGQVTDEELAAVTVLVLSRLSAAASAEASTTSEDPAAASWRRLERRGGYLAPHSWQAG